MECYAIIRDTPEGKFAVTFGSRNPTNDDIYDDFESAYLDACDYVDWDMHKIDVRVYPQYIKDIILLIIIQVTMNNQKV